MKQSLSLIVPPEVLQNKETLYAAVAKQLGISPGQINHIQLLKKSLDARRSIHYYLETEIYTGNSFYEEPYKENRYLDVSKAPEVIIVGSGPAGIFAALRATELGLRPIILEQGKNVKERKHDIANITRKREINSYSNWCFGEGGAGTYSDGKLYTRSTKRGNVQEILMKFVEHGASTDILLDSHAHIGTDKLSSIIENMRKTIEQCGGIYHFNTPIIDLLIKNNRVKGVRDIHGNSFEGIAVILATGHSARGIYDLFYRNNWALETKGFALGIRVEHPQELINQIQYRSSSRILPPASYSLVSQINGKGVFSFCMCPGGVIVPAATGPNELVLNGMSNSRRNSPFANAGIAVSISPQDFHSEKGPLALLHFQQRIEQEMYIAGNCCLSAPAQRMTDFCNSKTSSSLNTSSYLLGCTSSPLHELLPPLIKDTLQKAFPYFGKKMKGFYTENANIHAIESRTSSPIRIPRNPTFEHIELQGLFPCGEGAGYSGGIVSSAIDGMNCMNQLALLYKK